MLRTERMLLGPRLMGDASGECPPRRRGSVVGCSWWLARELTLAGNLVLAGKLTLSRKLAPSRELTLARPAWPAWPATSDDSAVGCADPVGRRGRCGHRTNATQREHTSSHQRRCPTAPAARLLLQRFRFGGASRLPVWRETHLWRGFASTLSRLRGFGGDGTRETGLGKVGHGIPLQGRADAHGWSYEARVFRGDL